LKITKHDSIIKKIADVKVKKIGVSQVLFTIPLKLVLKLDESLVTGIFRQDHVGQYQST
jgi:hypothetical protein